MRLNLTALTISAALVAGMTTFATAAPKSSESSDSSGGLLGKIFGPSSNETASTKPAKRAQARHAAKKAAAKKAAKPAQPENAAIAEAERELLNNNPGL